MRSNIFVLLATSALLLSIGCSKKADPTSSSSSSSGSGSSSSATPTTSGAKPQGGEFANCAACTSAPHTNNNAHWTFTGSFRDAKCSEPIASADFHPCQTVTIPTTAQVRFSEPVGTHKKAETKEITFAKPIPAEESAKLYKKADDGSCIAVTSGFKVVPNDCQGKRVCLDANKKLTCNAADCAKLPNDCPQFETARLYVGFTPN